MPSSKRMRVVWAAILLVSLANAMRVLQQQEAMRFFGVAIVVIAAVGVVGSISALILIAVRRVLSR
jgi:hypothetical protein